MIFFQLKVRHFWFGVNQNQMIFRVLMLRVCLYARQKQHSSILTCLLSKDHLAYSYDLGSSAPHCFPINPKKTARPNNDTVLSNACSSQMIACKIKTVSLHLQPTNKHTHVPRNVPVAQLIERGANKLMGSTSG